MRTLKRHAHQLSLLLRPAVSVQHRSQANAATAADMTREELIDAIWTEGVEIDRLDDDHSCEWSANPDAST
jgi:hypothetical protein